MKKIILFADVGGHEDQQYYHVGDEAMLYETHRWYRKYHPAYTLTVFSWFPTHSDMRCTEVPHLRWPKGRGSTYFLLLITKTLLWRLLDKSYFSKTELAVVTTIQQHDRIHFTGGGNLSSQFRPWLYYCFFVLFVAKLLRKEIIVTSQTIGPLTGIDRLSAVFF